MQQVRGEGDGACAHGLTYYAHVVASGAVDGGFVEVSGRSKEEAAGMRGDVLIRSGVYGTNTTEGEQKSRRGGGGFSGERSRPFKSGMHQARLLHTDRVLTGPR